MEAGLHELHPQGDPGRDLLTDLRGSHIPGKESVPQCPLTTDLELHNQVEHNYSPLD